MYEKLEKNEILFTVFFVYGLFKFCEFRECNLFVPYLFIHFIKNINF